MVLARLSSRRCRQREEESAALAGRAFGPDASAVLLHDAADQRKAEAGAAQRARIRRVALLEALEDPLQFFRRNAASLLLNDEADLASGKGIACRGSDGTRLRGQPDGRVLRSEEWRV